MGYIDPKIMETINALWPGAIWTQGYRDLWKDHFHDRNADWMVEALKLLRTLPAGKTYGKNPPEIYLVEKAWGAVCEQKRNHPSQDQRFEEDRQRRTQDAQDHEYDQQQRMDRLTAVPPELLREHMEEFEQIRHRYGLARPKTMNPKSWSGMYAGYFDIFLSEKWEQELEATQQ